MELPVELVTIILNNILLYDTGKFASFSICQVCQQWRDIIKKLNVNASFLLGIGISRKINHTTLNWIFINMNINQSFRQILYQCDKCNNNKFMYCLINQYIPNNNKSRSVLWDITCIALKKRNEKLIKILKDKNSLPQYRPETFSMELYYGNPPVIKLLFKYNMIKDVKEKLLLYYGNHHIEYFRHKTAQLFFDHYKKLFMVDNIHNYNEDSK